MCFIPNLLVFQNRGEETETYFLTQILRLQCMKFRGEHQRSMKPAGTSTEISLFSNILSAYSFITENPERAALCFVSGICIGLLLTLLALVVQISCQTDCKQSSTQRPPCNSDGSWSDSDSDTTSDLSVRRQRRFERTLNMNVFTSAEELERAQRLEERERIIREIWMNGQPDIPGTRSLNRYY